MKNYSIIILLALCPLIMALYASDNEVAAGRQGGRGGLGGSRPGGGAGSAGRGAGGGARGAGRPGAGAGGVGGGAGSIQRTPSMSRAAAVPSNRAGYNAAGAAAGSSYYPATPYYGAPQQQSQYAIPGYNPV